MDELRELAAELADNWRDPYWWADHPALRTGLLCVLAGVIGLAFEYGKLRMQLALTGGPPA